VAFGEDAEPGQRPQQPIQRVGISARSGGQFLAALRTLVQQVSDAELSRHVDGLLTWLPTSNCARA
jgi:hypothetical protein